MARHPRATVPPALRPYTAVLSLGQILGALAGYHWGTHASWVDNLWVGGALATLPAYGLGLAALRIIRPGTLTAYTGSMLIHGGICILLTGIGWIYHRVHM